MKPLAVLVRDGWADWEAGYILGIFGHFLGGQATIATPDGATLRSSGGIRISADASFDDLVADNFSAIALIGGPGWLDGDQTVTSLLRTAEATGVPIGAICAATATLAQSGLLDDRAHTSNSAEFLRGVGGYHGLALYEDSPSAVIDRGVVTAAGTAPATFAVSLLSLALPTHSEMLQSLLSQTAREHEQRPAV